MASQTPTQSQAQQAVQRLKFKGKLAQKGSSTDALLKRIKVGAQSERFQRERQIALYGMRFTSGLAFLHQALHTELANLEQELVDVDTLNNVCRELIEPTLMLHKDRAVKAFVACCLADMLRLYAPNAPFTASELKVRCVLPRLGAFCTTTF